MAGTPTQKTLLQKGHSKHEPIALVDDDDDVAVHGSMPKRCAEVEEIIRRRDAARLRREVIYIDEDDAALDDEIKRIVEEDEAELIEEIQRIDLTQEEDDDQRPAQHPRLRQHATRSNWSLHSARQSVSAHKFNGVQVRVNDCVELKGLSGEWSIQFVAVKSIWITHDQVTLRGIPYARTRNLHGRLEHKRNEVCQILEVEADDARSIEEKALIEISINEVLTVRVLNKTNASFPQCRFASDPSWLRKSRAEREEQGPLTCRWIMRIDYQNARHRRDGRPIGGALIHLIGDDVRDEVYRIADQDRRDAWRGKETESRQQARRYTFGDAFCGAGGATRGAIAGGFEVRLWLYKV